MLRRSLSLAIAIAAATMIQFDPKVARADDNAEAAALFDRGNDHLRAAMRLRGDRRTREIEAALDDYFASLRIVRSRNVVFNAAIALEMLERNEEAFNYFVEYARAPGLPEDDRADAMRRVDALRTRVAVVRIESEPASA